MILLTGRSSFSLSMTSTVYIKFIGFWPTFDIHHNVFVDALRSKHNIHVLDKSEITEPDILFYSREAHGVHLKYNCIKIYYTAENDFPDFNECDYAISFNNLDFGKRHLRYPLYMLYEYDRINTPLSMTDSQAVERPFCSLLMRNASNCHPRRLQIIDAVNNYKELTYGGSFRNNIGGCVDEKIPFINKFKFNLALENNIVDGYVTEKILEPFVAYTVPIYWGSELAAKDFNPHAFINVSDFDTTEGFVDYLKKVDNDESLYLKILKAPKINTQTAPDFGSMLADFLDNVISSMKRYIYPYGEINISQQRHKRMWKMLNSFWLRNLTKVWP